jgi:hypothetical protein
MVRRLRRRNDPSQTEDRFLVQGKDDRVMSTELWAIVSLASLMLSLSALWLIVTARRRVRADVARLAALAERLDRLESHRSAVQGGEPSGAAHESTPLEAGAGVRLVGDADRPAPRSNARGNTRADGREATPGPPPTLIAVPSLAAAGMEDLSEATNALERRFAAVWELADGGASPEAIAGATHYPVGQVELILGLRRRLVAEGKRSDPE